MLAPDNPALPFRSQPPLALGAACLRAAVVDVSPGSLLALEAMTSELLGAEAMVRAATAFPCRHHVSLDRPSPLLPPLLQGSIQGCYDQLMSRRASRAAANRINPAPAEAVVAAAGDCQVLPVSPAVRRVKPLEQPESCPRPSVEIPAHGGDLLSPSEGLDSPETAAAAAAAGGVAAAGTKRRLSMDTRGSEESEATALLTGGGALPPSKRLARVARQSVGDSEVA